MISRAASFDSATPSASAASRYQLDRQLRQKPARFIRSMFWTSPRSRKCCTSRRKAAASKSRLWSSLSSGIRELPVLRPSHRPGARAEHLHVVYIGTAVDGVNDGRQPLGPGEGARAVGDQVLADLDQRMGIALDDGMAEHG